MKIRSLIVALSLVVFITSCGSGGTYGEAFEVENAITVSDLYEKLAQGDKAHDVVVHGTIEEVCQVKGCWMTLRTDYDGGMRVTFKDYGFFVPMDISGKSVYIKGVGMTQVTSVEEQIHYAEDVGESAEAIANIVAPLEENVFIASGVIIAD